MTYLLKSINMEVQLFADDAAIVAHTPEDIREICKQFGQAGTMFGLTINTKKTVTLYQPPPGQTSIDPHVEIYGTPLNSVKNILVEQITRSIVQMMIQA